MARPATWLAAAVHDPDGRILPALERLADRMQDVFCGIGLNISDATAPAIVDAARSVLGARVIIHPADETRIGRIRRDAVTMGLDHPQILYSDFDHMLRWIEHGRDDLSAILNCQADIEFLVVGRSDASFAAEPQRLQETERVVNHVHAMITGNDWDLMFAVRRMSAGAARTIVEESMIDTLANDVEWPLLARRAGLSIGYAQSEALFYRTMEEFGAAADSGDARPLEWIRRLEFAALHASAMRRFLQ